MTAWHPISTAPRDGTLVDLWVVGDRDTGRRTDCKWVDACVPWSKIPDRVIPAHWSRATVMVDEEYIEDFRDLGGDDCHLFSGTATHWMARPDPPKE